MRHEIQPFDRPEHCLAGLRHPQLFSRAWEVAPADIGVSARQAYLEVRVVHLIKRKIRAVLVERLKLNDLPRAVGWQEEIDATVKVVARTKVTM